MKIAKLTAEGELTQEMIREFGDEFTIQERMAKKIYGLGHLRLKEGNASLMEFYQQENNTIKTHFDWTKKGAIIRMRTMKKLYAFGLRDDQIELITLTKYPDFIYAIPLLPFWILLKLKVRLSIAKWFRSRGDKLIYGPAIIQLSLFDHPTLTFQLEGSLWKDCVSTFGMDRVKEKLTVVDKRSKDVNYG
ncbi:MAG: hypothetical protein HYZ44_11705 [Bacteroidetes bacterium]|nr:hypothetical protein [Bacteroidota bacterium]